VGSTAGVAAELAAWGDAIASGAARGTAPDTGR